MAKRSKKTQKLQDKPQDFAVVTFVEDLEQARDYKTLLKANDIPAMIKEQDKTRQVGTKGIAVMVPEDFLDEAHVVIESQDAYDDFYDLALEDDSDLDNELFEDDF